MKTPRCRIYRQVSQPDGNVQQIVCNAPSLYVVHDRYHVCRECGEKYLAKNRNNLDAEIKLIDERLANFT